MFHGLVSIQVVRCHPRASTRRLNAMNTILPRCNLSQMVQTIGHVVREKSWKDYMGFPLCQTVPGMEATMQAAAYKLNACIFNPEQV
jgi:hypothetical protein